MTTTHPRLVGVLDHGGCSQAEMDPAPTGQVELEDVVPCADEGVVLGAGLVIIATFLFLPYYRSGRSS
ncbi:hypothetical protein ACF05T_33635 [Streptomyces lateritius]|uniref:Uncharacterized protein n=1 Tax=Streptomyces lateritius TaxID=67313 RepID=A0ABW6YM32_9ACTN